MTPEQKKQYDELIASGMSHDEAVAALTTAKVAPSKLDNVLNSIEQGSAPQAAPVESPQPSGKTISPEEEAKFRKDYRDNSLVGRIKSWATSPEMQEAARGATQGAQQPGYAEVDPQSEDYVAMPKSIKNYGDNMMNKLDRKVQGFNTADLNEHQMRIYQIELNRTGNAAEAFKVATDPLNSDVRPYGKENLPPPLGLTKMTTIFPAEEKVEGQSVKVAPDYDYIPAPEKGMEPTAPVVKKDALSSAVDTVAEEEEGSQKTGLDLQNYYQRVGGIESGNKDDAANPNSQARGRYQFMPKTARDLGYKPEDRFDPVKSQEMMEKLTLKHVDAFRNEFGRDPSESELYMMHQQGQGKALKLIGGKDDDKLAVDVLGRKEVIDNGGKATMTMKEYRDYWENRYNQWGGQTPPPATRVQPAVTTTSDQELGSAFDRGVSGAEGEAYPEEQGRGLPPPRGPETPYKFGNYKQSDGQSLFGSLVSLGLTYLAGRALGESAGDSMAAGLLAGGATFANALNRNARAQNIEHLLERGFGPESIEAFIVSGDPEKLKQQEKAEWKSVGDGTGRLWRIGEDGQPEFSSPTSQKFIDIIGEDGDKYAAYMDDQGRVKRDAQGKPVISHKVAVGTATGSGIGEGGAGPQGEITWRGSDGVVYTTNTKGRAVPASRDVATTFTKNEAGFRDTDFAGPKGPGYEKGQYQVQRNARGSLEMDKKSGMVYVYDHKNGRFTSLWANDVKAEAAATQALEGLQVMEAFDESLFDYTGSYAQGYLKRKGTDVLGQNTTKDMEAEFETMNEVVKGQVLAVLMVESGGNRVTDNMLEAEKKRIGELSLENSPALNRKIFERQQAFLNKAFNYARTHRLGEHNTAETSDYGTPTGNVPSVSTQGGTTQLNQDREVAPLFNIVQPGR